MFIEQIYCLIYNMEKSDFKKINDYLWEIPKQFRAGMRVPVRVYASEKMLGNILEDKSIEQLINTAHLPGIINYSLAMPDAHQGYGFPIGGVAAIDAEQGVISPGGVGFDINCGMRLLVSSYSKNELDSHLNELASEIQAKVPSGLGEGREMKFSVKEIDKVLEGGARYLTDQGYGQERDVENCEQNGKLEQADASLVSQKAKTRGRNQVGALGSGNHFVELQTVDKVFDKKTAEVFGLSHDQVAVMVHTGSRGLGHQIATDYIKIMVNAMSKYGIKLPDRQLAACPFNSSEGQTYFKAMCAGANYAWANRQMITHFIRKAWKNVLGGESAELKVIYDVAHNIAKIEQYDNQKMVVHRKGATQAFPPSHSEIPDKYREIGQPALIPGSMGTSSYVLAGQETGKDSWYSTCHGAGRTMSRHAAMKKVRGEEVVNRLKQEGILVKCRSMRGIAEEAPLAYKNINDVVEVVHQAGLSKKVARLKPLAVIKGE